MKISTFKIFIVFLILSVLGLFILPKLSVKLNPSSTLPSVMVSYSWPNASPYNLERDVTTKLEAGFSTLKGIENINSKSSNGSGYISLNFDKRTDIDVARFEIATIIRQLYKQLPEETSYPTLSINRLDDSESRAFLSYSIKAPDTPSNIHEKVTTQINPIISGIQGIDKTEVYGGNTNEYIITFNNNALKTLQLTKLDLIEAVQNAFERETLGHINYNDNYIALTIQPLTKDIDWHIPIKKAGDRLVFLDELTSIKVSEQEAQSYYRINGDNAITLNVFATKQANTIVLAETVSNKLDDLKIKLPENYTIIKTYDSSIYLKQELDKIYERSLYTVIILLLFILLVSKSFKYLLVTILSLIANISVAFLMYYIFKIEIQLYSLAGITISLGLIIDNSIVMIDHIRHQNNRKVFLPILASTLTTIGALIIIYFLDDKYKVNLIDFALVIIVNLSVSLSVAMFLIPALIKKIKLPVKTEKNWVIKMKNRFYRVYYLIISTQLRFKKLTILFIILIFGLPFYMLPKKLDNNMWFGEAYNKTIGSYTYKEKIRPHLDLYLGGSFRLFNQYVFNDAYYGKNEETKIYVTGSMARNTTIYQMNVVFKALEKYLEQYKDIKDYTVKIDNNNYAKLEITFKDYASKSSFPFLLKSRLIRKVLDFGGIDWNISGVGSGFNSGNSNSGEPVNFSVKAKGYNYDQLNIWADSLKTSLEQHPRIQKVIVKDNSYWSRKLGFEYYLNLNKEQLALSNTSPLKIINELKPLTLSKYEDISLKIKNKHYPIRIESEESKKFDIWQLKNVPLDSLERPLTLKNIASVNKSLEDESIYKENQEYVRLVQFQYTGSSKYGSIFLKQNLKEFESKLPLGYTFEDSQKQFLINNDQSNYIYLLCLILGIIYIICAILFESFKQPFIILSVIPISFIGVFLTFYLFKFNFDQGGLASFVLLSGITVNASILIINSFNQLKKKFPNQNKIELYLEAFKQKIFPVMLTIISTILGFIPFIKDGQNEVFWFALGVGAIGGLMFSLIGILFYLPLFTLKKLVK